LLICQSLFGVLPAADLGYGDFVKAIQNPRHKRHRELLEWVVGEFDSEEFDLEAVNEELQGVG